MASTIDILSMSQEEIMNIEGKSSKDLSKKEIIFLISNLLGDNFTEEQIALFMGIITKFDNKMIRTLNELPTLIAEKRSKEYMIKVLEYVLTVHKDETLEGDKPEEIKSISDLEKIRLQGGNDRMALLLVGIFSKQQIALISLMSYALWSEDEDVVNKNINYSFLKILIELEEKHGTPYIFNMTERYINHTNSKGKENERN